MGFQQSVTALPRLTDSWRIPSWGRGYSFPFQLQFGLKIPGKWLCLNGIKRPSLQFSQLLLPLKSEPWLFIRLTLRVVWSLSPLSPLFTLPSDSALHSVPGSLLPEALGADPQIGSNGPASAHISSAHVAFCAAPCQCQLPLYPMPVALCFFILWRAYPSSVYYM